MAKKSSIHLKDFTDLDFENWNFILNIFQETQDFLVLADPINICNYLQTTDKHFRDWGNVQFKRHPNSKLVKCVLVQTSNTSLRIFAAWKAPFVQKWKTVPAPQRMISFSRTNSSIFISTSWNMLNFSGIEINKSLLFQSTKCPVGQIQAQKPTLVAAISIASNITDNIIKVIDMQ